MANQQPIPEIPQLGSESNRLAQPKRKTHAEIHRTQTGVRGAVRSLLAWVGIVGGSVAGGITAGNMSAQAVHGTVRPIINSIDEAVSPEICEEEYEGFKKIIIRKMDGTVGEIINGALDSVGMRRKVQGWLNAITESMNDLRKGLCAGLEKIPELTNAIDKLIQKLTKLVVSLMTGAMLLMALSRLYKGHRRRSLANMANNTLAELEEELARGASSQEELATTNARLEARLMEMERILLENGMMKPPQTGGLDALDDIPDIE